MSLFFRPGAEERAMDASWFGIDPDRPASVNAENASHLAPVFAAIRHIVDFLSTLPVDAYRRGSDVRDPMPNLPALLRNEDALGRDGVGQWIGQIAYGLVVHGNAVGWVVETDAFGYPTVVRWLRREDWDLRDDGVWRVFQEPVSSSRIVHIPWIVPTGCRLGMSPIEHYAAIVRAGLSAQDYSDVKRGGGVPPTHLKNNQLTLDPAVSASVRDRAASAFATGKPFVSGKDWDLNVMSIPPNHAMFIETLKLSANQIAAIYGIDPREIGGSASESLTYSTDESRSLNRANNMRPYIVRIENGISRLLPERQYIRLNVDATIRTDIKTRTEVIGAQIADGRMSVNEARQLEERTPVPGGDRYNVPAPSAAPTQRTGDTP